MKNVIIIPGQEQTDDSQELSERIIDAETALSECRQALVLLFTWHQSKKSKFSQGYSAAFKQLENAAVAIGAYLEAYGKKTS